MAESHNVDCPGCKRGLVVEATISVPDLPCGIYVRCPACSQPLVIARMPEGVRAYAITLTADVAAVQPKSRKALPS